ncbi:hypothetical protein F5Y04DRAFT_279669 [Hypomontagnella monticulosa]|nr:hypothetical protein F5Y04DRAFT_279669 [Hypomontagnella monticulosa]
MDERSVYPNIGNIISHDNRRKRPSYETDGDTVWLLRELKEDSQDPGWRNQLDDTPYLEELVLYEAILDVNLARLNIDAPTSEIYQRLGWNQGQSKTLPEQHFARYAYIRELNFQFYRDKDFFRCLVASFWGDNVASVFQTIEASGPFIQIAFKNGREYTTGLDKYKETVEMFAHIMARISFVKGMPGTITDVFGFKLVKYCGSVVSSIEHAGRALKNDYLDGAKYLVIQHVWSPKEPTVINIWD